MERIIWKNKTLLQARGVGNQVFGLTDEWANIFLKEEFMQATRNFIEEVRRFDPALQMTDIFQALRNVWIMNCLQKFLGRPVRYSPSIFAYSMLYPYTDNFLDEPEISPESKMVMSRRFARRLKGELVQPENPHEQHLYQLVRRIEEQYPRPLHPSIYGSLLAIHTAQEKSLQQQCKFSSPYERDLLGISFEKGGTSVLADGFLVKQNLKLEEASFVFGFGVVLQLIDDLQDVRTDLKNGHMTVFSQIAGKWPLDGLASRLLHFMRNILASGGFIGREQSEELVEVIQQHCQLLILHAIIDNREFFSNGFLQMIGDYSPFHFPVWKKLGDRIAKEYRSLQKAHGALADELLDDMLNGWEEDSMIDFSAAQIPLVHS